MVAVRFSINSKGGVSERDRGMVTDPPGKRLRSRHCESSRKLDVWDVRTRPFYFYQRPMIAIISSLQQ